MIGIQFNCVALVAGVLHTDNNLAFSCRSQMIVPLRSAPRRLGPLVRLETLLRNVEHVVHSATVNYGVQRLRLFIRVSICFLGDVIDSTCSVGWVEMCCHVHVSTTTVRLFVFVVRSINKLWHIIKVFMLCFLGGVIDSTLS